MHFFRHFITQTLVCADKGRLCGYKSSLSVEGVPCKRQEAGGFEGDLNLAGNEHIRLKREKVTGG